MENWRAGLIGFGIVLVGIGGYSSLEGVWKGLSLVAAGIALVLLGLSLERKPRVAAETVGEIAGEASDELDVTVPMTAVAVEDAEATVPLKPIQVSEAEASEPEPEAAGPEVSEPEPEVAAPDESAVPEAASETEAALVEEEGSSTSAAAEAELPPSEEAEREAVDETVHRHDQPMLGHSELVSHIRDYHEGVPFDGSTIQLRLLHERAHA